MRVMATFRIAVAVGALTEVDGIAHIYIYSKKINNGKANVQISQEIIEMD